MAATAVALVGLLIPCGPALAAPGDGDGNESEQLKTLQAQLEQQMHDSIRVRKQRKFLFWLYLEHPPVYDSAKAAQSKKPVIKACT